MVFTSKFLKLTEGNDDFILDIPSLSRFQLGKQMGDPLVDQDGAFRGTKFTHNPARVFNIPVGGQTGFLQNSGEGHGGNVPVPETEIDLY